MMARLNKVMSLFISRNQPAFVQNRQIREGDLVINELVGLTKRYRRTCIFKIYFEKAYDSVSWNYLRSIMVIKSFGAR